MLKVIDKPSVEIKVGSTKDVALLNNVIVMREVGKLNFVDIDTHNILKTVVFDSDHPMGYRRLANTDDFICTAVHSRSVPNELFGDPKHVELHVFNSNGDLLWSKELRGWTVSSNRGGMHRLDEDLVICEKVEDKTILGLYNFETGALIDELETDLLPNIAQSYGEKNDVFVEGNQIFYNQNNRFVCFSKENKKLLKKEVLGVEVYRGTISSNKLFATHIMGNDLIMSTIELGALRVINEKKLNFDFDFDRMIISQDSKYLVMNYTNKRFIACYDLELNELSWKKEIDPEIASTQIRFIDDRTIFYLAGIEGGVFGLIDVKTGNELARYTHRDESSRPKFPTLFKKELIVVNFNSHVSILSRKDVLNYVSS